MTEVEDEGKWCNVVGISQQLQLKAKHYFIDPVAMVMCI